MKTLAVVIVLLASLCHAEGVTLAWDAPTNNVDGTAITETLGYKVYWGLSSNAMYSCVDVKSNMTYVLPPVQFTNGVTYYFATSAYSFINFAESGKSEVLRYDFVKKPNSPKNGRWQ